MTISRSGVLKPVFIETNKPSPLSDDYDILLANTSGKPNDVVTQNSDLFSPNKCFLMTVYNTDNQEIQSDQKHFDIVKQKLVTETVEANIFYYSVHYKKEIKASFPAVAVFVRSTKPECQSLRYDD